MTLYHSCNNYMTSICSLTHTLQSHTHTHTHTHTHAIMHARAAVLGAEARARDWSYALAANRIQSRACLLLGKAEMPLAHLLSLEEPHMSWRGCAPLLWECYVGNYDVMWLSVPCYSPGLMLLRLRALHPGLLGNHGTWQPPIH